MSNDPPQFAAVLGRVISGLFILTLRNGVRETGLLVSWVQQCSFDPPQITLCVKQGRDILDWLTEGSPLTLNLVGEGQKKFLSHFGKGFSLDEDAFSGLAVERREGEAPILSEALGHLLCRVAGRASAGDHEIVIATVVGGRLLSDGAPYVHSRKSGMRY